MAKLAGNGGGFSAASNDFRPATDVVRIEERRHEQKRPVMLLGQKLRARRADLGVVHPAQHPVGMLLQFGASEKLALRQMPFAGVGTFIAAGGQQVFDGNGGAVGANPPVVDDDAVLVRVQPGQHARPRRRTDRTGRVRFREPRARRRQRIQRRGFHVRVAGATHGVGELLVGENVQDVGTLARSFCPQNGWRGQDAEGRPADSLDKGSTVDDAFLHVFILLS
jgi:hypothetical protein